MRRVFQFSLLVLGAGLLVVLLAHMDFAEVGARLIGNQPAPQDQLLFDEAVKHRLHLSLPDPAPASQLVERERAAAL